MNLSITTEECILFKNLLDEKIDSIDNSILEIKDQLKEQNQDSDDYIRNLQYSFEWEEESKKLSNVKKKIHTHCVKVFATPQWQAQLK